MNKELLLITAVVIISAAIALGWSIGVKGVLPSSLSQNQINQDNVTAIYHQGLIQSLLGNYSGALHYYKQGLSIDPYDYYILSSVGKVLYYLHKYTGAINYLDRALTIDPRDVFSLDYKGLVLIALHNYTGALTYFDRSLSLNRNAGVLDDKAIAFYKLGNYQDALSNVNASLTIDPRDESAYYNKGLIIATQGAYIHNIGDLGTALQYFDKALSINPGDRDTVYNKALLTQFIVWAQKYSKEDTIIPLND